MRVLGVDPGTRAMGFGILESVGGNIVVLEFGCLKLSSNEALQFRLQKIYHEIRKLVLKYKPDQVAIENLFYAKNPKVAIKMGHARGVAMVAAVNQDVPTFEYAPREIKQAVAGNGAASKEQVQRMLQHILNLKDLSGSFDASDALAVAFCHLNRSGRKI
jgi:crossover junction endodeoxyribonuclease RuvC